VLVGDPNQLQSVDVGSVMSDLVQAGASHEELGSGSGGVHLVTLETPYRVASASGRATLLEWFKSVREGLQDEALALLEGANPAVTFLDVATLGADEASAAVWESVVGRARSLRALAQSPNDGADHLAAIDVAMHDVMVLTAQHQGELSRTWWVQRIADAVGMSVDGAPSAPGVPVLVTHTDRGNGVTNGDTGLIVRRHGELVYVPVPATTEQAMLPAASVHQWQPWWAMTIHKSQGSEFDDVVVSITPGSRLVSRQLFYTAITRAKRSVTVIGLRDDIARAISEPARRFTGLTEQIRELRDDVT
jgi:exodeoxyribonuclease V alpha subunit